MEYGILIGLGILGTYINNNSNNDNNKSLKRSKSMNNILSNDQDNIYNSKIIKNLSNNIQNKAIDRKNKSKNPATTNVIPPNYNNLKHFNIIDKSNELVMGTTTNELLKYDNNKETYTSQFDPLTFDNNDQPVSINESYKTDRSKMLNIERSLAFNNKFSPFDQETDMTYGVIDKEHFTHNNMQPFTSQRDKILDDINNNKNEVLIDRYTGSSRYYFQKKEIEPFFEPQINKDTSFVNGVPNVTDQQRTRYIPSLIKQNERPFEPIQVTPGLNLKSDEIGTQGFFDQFRPNLKTTDELRPSDKPKLSYTQPVLEGKKGEKRSVTAPFIKRKPETTKEVKTSEYVPTGSIVKTQKTPDNFDIKENNRQQKMEVFGPLGYYNNVITNQQTVGKFNDPLTKSQLFEERGNLTFTNKYNPNEKSITILDNQRHSTNNPNMNIGNKFYNSNTIAIDYNDLPRETIKQTLLYENNGYTGNNQQNGIAFSNDYEMKSTIRQIDNQPLNTNFSYRNNNIGYTNLNDQAKSTIRQIDNQPLNTNLSYKNNNIGYTNLNDQAKSTIRESYCNIEYNKNTNSMMKANYTELSDPVKITNRQSLTNTQLNTNLSSLNHNTTTHFNDIAKNTIKESLNTIPVNLYPNSNFKSIYSNMPDQAKNTIKQTLSQQQFNTNINNNNNGLYTQFNDVAKNTIKQTTQQQFNNFLTNVTTSYSNLNDNARTTIRQIITELDGTSRPNIGSINMANIANLSDEAKITLKQILTLQEFNNNLKSHNGAIYSNLTDTAKPTTKEVLSMIENNLNLQSNHLTHTTHLQDKPKNSLKEINVIQNQNTHINTSQFQTTPAFDFNDLMRPTIKQNVFEEFNIATFKNPQTYLKDYTDIANPTIRQTTGETNHINPANKNIESIINNAHIDPTQREFITLKNYLAGMSGPNEVISEMDARNMNQNLSKEIIAQGRTPTQGGPTFINNKSMLNVELKNTPFHSRMETGGFNGAGLILDNRDYWKSSDFKNLNYVDDRLTNKLISALETNPLINTAHKYIINKKQDDNTNYMLNNLSGKALIDSIQ